MSSVHIALTLCTLAISPSRWLDDLLNSGMGMLSVQSLSGYDIDMNDIETNNRMGLKRIDRSDRSVNLYVDEVNQDCSDCCA